MDGIGISRRASCERRIKPPPRRRRTSSHFQNDNLTRRRQRIHAPKPLHARGELVGAIRVTTKLGGSSHENHRSPRYRQRSLHLRRANRGQLSCPARLLGG